MTDVSRAVAADIHAGLSSGGIGLASYLPDSSLFGVEQLLEVDPDITAVRCVREDEGVAIAVGAAMGGVPSVAVMEGTGLGYCGLILARAKLQATPLLVIFSHAAGPGEGKPFHATAIAASTAALRGLDIPFTVLDRAGRIRDTVAQAVTTASGQRCLYALAVPGYIHPE